MPVDQDALHSHERIADTLNKIIHSNNGGTTIGLEGEWGSGKSTIIKILCKKFNRKQGTYFFSFDAWVHQGDPLRRAFLEALISKATNEGWFHPDGEPTKESQALVAEWLDEKDGLSKRKRSYTKEVEPEITWFSRFLLTSFLFVPVGSSIALGALNSTKFSPHFSWAAFGFAEAMIVLGGLLVLLPVVILLLGLIFSDQKKAWSIFLQKSHVSESSTTTESLDTSTIEFQDLFSKLMSNLLKDKPERKNTPDRLVIVLDNLDRLPASEAADVWPVLRSFIDNPGFVDTRWFERLWVIVPYARDALMSSEQLAGHDNMPPQVIAAGAELGKAAPAPAPVNPYFLDKVFQITLHVPPPVPSNWRAYLNKLLEQAFANGCTENDAHTIYLLFVRHFGFVAPPGPREIKNIVNSMVTTAMQWLPTIPLTHQAYFAVLKRGGAARNLRADLQKDRIELHADLLGEQVANSLVALEYGVPVDVASQILFEPVLKTILAMNGDGMELAKRYANPGFAVFFDSHIGEVLAENAEKPVLFMQNIALLCRADFTAVSTVESRRHVVREVGKALDKLKALPMHDSNLVDTAVGLARLDTEKRAAASLLHAFERTLSCFTHDDGASLFGTKGSRYMERTQLERAHAFWSCQELWDYIGTNAPARFVFPGQVDDILVMIEILQKTGAEHLLGIFDLAPVRDRLRSDLVGKRNSNRSLSQIVELLEVFDRYGTPGTDDIYGELIDLVVRHRSTGLDVVRYALPYLLKLAPASQTVQIMLLESTSSGWPYHFLGIYNPRVPEQYAFPGITSWKITQIDQAERVRICAQLVYLLLMAQDVSAPSASDEMAQRGYRFYRRLTANPCNRHDVVEALHALVIDHGSLDAFKQHLLASGQEQLLAMFGSMHSTSNARKEGQRHHID